MRLSIAAIGDDEVHLVWTTHHVLLDGWSTVQVLSEVWEQYAAIVTGRAPALVTRRPFRDYPRWLREQDPRAAEEHWRQELAGVGRPPRCPSTGHRWRPIARSPPSRCASSCPPARRTGCAPRPAGTA
jgi:hypothetical protein